MSPSEGVISDVSTIVFAPLSARYDAAAAEQVVLPTPPLPPKRIMGLSFMFGAGKLVRNKGS
jgi:hypothetical protein